MLNTHRGKCLFLNRHCRMLVSSFCMLLLAIICEETIPWMSVVQSMKELGPKCRFSKSLKKSTIGRGERERGFITADLNKKCNRDLFFPHTVVKGLVPFIESECN